VDFVRKSPEITQKLVGIITEVPEKITEQANGITAGP